VRHFGWFGNDPVPIVESTALVDIPIVVDPDGLVQYKYDPDTWAAEWAKRLERGTTGAVFVSCRDGHTATCVHAAPVADLADLEL